MCVHVCLWESVSGLAAQLEEVQSNGVCARVRLCIHVVKRWPHSPSFHSPFVYTLYCTLLLKHTHTHTFRHTHTHTHTHSQLQPTLRDRDRPCRLTQKLLILLSAAMNDLPWPISEFRNEFNTNNDSGRIL